MAAAGWTWLPGLLALLLVIVPAPVSAQERYPPLPPEALPGLLSSEFVQTSRTGECRSAESRPRRTEPTPYYRIGINGFQITRTAGFAGLNEVRLDQGQGTLAIWATAPGTAQYRSLSDCGYWETTIVYAGPPLGDGIALPLTVTYSRPRGATTVDPVPQTEERPQLDLGLRAEHERPPSGKAELLVNTRGDLLLSVTNLGRSPAGPLIVSDTLPGGMTFLPARSGGATTQGADTRWECDGRQAPEIVCRNPVLLNPGQATRVRVAVDVSREAFPEAPGELSGKVCRTVQNRPVLRFADANTQNNQALDNLPVCVAPDLDLRLTGPPSPFALDRGAESGETPAQYRLTVTNVGSSATRDAILLSGQLPEGVELREVAGATPAGIDPSWVCEPPNVLQARQVTCRNDARLGPGEQTTVQLGTVFRNGAWLLSGPGQALATARVSTADDEDPLTNESILSTQVATRATTAPEPYPPLVLLDKRLQASLSPSGRLEREVLFPGREAEYRISVKNFGPGALPAPIVLQDLLPEGETFVGYADRSQLDPPVAPSSATGGRGILVGPNTQWTLIPRWRCVPAGRQVTCTANTGLAEGEALVLYLRVRVGAVTTATLTNTVRLSPDVRASVTSAVRALDDLRIGKVLNAPFREQTPGVFVGQFTITVVNFGDTDAPGPIRVMDTLGPGLRVLQTFSQSFACAPPGPVPPQLTCTRADPLPPRGTAEVQVVVATDAETRTRYTNQAVLVGARGDVDVTGLGGNARLDLALNKLLVIGLGTGVFAYEDEVEFVLRVTNVGEDPAAGPMVVRDVLPPGLTFISAEGSNWRCAAAPVVPQVPLAGSVVTCTIDADVEPGDRLPDITLKAAVAVKPRAEVDLANRATLDYPDANPANNRAEQKVSLVPLPDLAVGLVHAPPTNPSGGFLPGFPITYTLTVANVGTELATGAVKVMQALPPGLNFADLMPGAGWQCTPPGPRASREDAQEVTCTNANPGGLAPGQGLAAITIAALPQDDTVRSTATLDYPDNDPTNNTAVDVVRLGDLPDLAISATHEGERDPANPETLTLAVRNIGDGATLGPMTVDLVLSGGLRYSDLLKGSQGIDGGWSCATGDPDRQRVSCTNPLLLRSALPGTRPDPSVTTLRIQATVSQPGNPSEVPTLAAVVTTPGDTNRDNDAAVIRLGPLPDLAVDVRHEGGVHPGAPDLFTVAVRNVGERPTLGPTTLELVLASGARFVGLLPGTAGIDAGWTCEPGPADRQRVTCTNGGLLPPAQADPPQPDPSVTTLRVQVSVGPSADPPGTPTLRAVASTPGDTNPDNDAAGDSAPTP